MLLSAAFLAAMTSVSAQKLTYVPYADNGYLMGTYISSDGRYIAGGDAKAARASSTTPRTARSSTSFLPRTATRRRTRAQRCAPSTLMVRAWAMSATNSASSTSIRANTPTSASTSPPWPTP